MDHMREGLSHCVAWPRAGRRGGKSCVGLACHRGTPLALPVLSLHLLGPWGEWDRSLMSGDGVGKTMAKGQPST